MNAVNEVIDGIGDSFAGLFNGGGLQEMSTPAKVGIAVAVVVIVLVLIYIIYKMTSSSMYGGGRNVGPSGCCGKLQNQRVQVVEAALSQQDMDENNADYAMAGFPRISTYYQNNGIDNLQFPQGFASPSAKPDSNYETPMADHLGGTHAMVRPQVPTLPYQRPAIGEADFINMAYSA
jgi:hypothetical protein